MATYDENDKLTPESLGEICDKFKAEHEAHKKAGGAEDYLEFLQDKLANVLIALKAFDSDPAHEAAKALATCEREFPEETGAPAPN